MARAITPAQRAAQITFVLKGHLKNAQISYIRAAGLLPDLDSALGRLNAVFGALARAMRLGNPRGIRLAAIGGKSLPG